MSHADRKQTNGEKQGLLLRNKMLRDDCEYKMVSCRFRPTLCQQSDKNWLGKEHQELVYQLVQNLYAIIRTSQKRPE